LGAPFVKVERLRGAPSQAEKSTISPDFVEKALVRRRFIAGGLNVELVHSTGGRADAGRDCHHP
jgi:hypothetical protein